MNTDVSNANGGLKSLSNHVWLRVGYEIKLKDSLRTISSPSPKKAWLESMVNLMIASAL